MPMFRLLHYFYSLLTVTPCHSVSESLYPEIKLQEKAREKTSHSPGRTCLVFGLIMCTSLLIEHIDLIA